MKLESAFKTLIFVLICKTLAIAFPLKFTSVASMPLPVTVKVLDVIDENWGVDVVLILWGRLKVIAVPVAAAVKDPFTAI